MISDLKIGGGGGADFGDQKMVRFSLAVMGFVALCLSVAATEAQDMKYKDPNLPLNVRIKDLMGRMTLEEKIGQMTQIERSVASAAVMNKYFIGMHSSFIQIMCTRKLLCIHVFYVSFFVLEQGFS